CYQLEGTEESDAANGKHDANASLKVCPQEARERGSQQRQKNRVDEEKANCIPWHGLYRGHEIIHERVDADQDYSQNHRCPELDNELRIKELQEVALSIGV